MNPGATGRSRSGAPPCGGRGRPAPAAPPGCPAGPHGRPPAPRCGRPPATVRIRWAMTSTVLPRSRRERGGLDGALVFHIQAGGGLVQQHHRRVLQQGPGDGDPLPLPAGKGGAVLPDHRLVALGQFADEFIALGGFGGPSSTSSSVAPRRPRRMFSITVSRNSTTSWNTME